MSFLYSHELHAFHLDLHQDARQYMRQIKDANKRRWARGKQPFRQQTVEVDNFQDPQVSSTFPVALTYSPTSTEISFPDIESYTSGMSLINLSSHSSLGLPFSTRI